jgi:xanthine dehydrogenase YagS FAD-binding subunit
VNRFEYVRPDTVLEAVASVTAPGAVFLAGGTNLLELTKGGVMRPARVVDLTRVPDLERIEWLPHGAMRIGALARNSDLAYDTSFARGYPAVSDALLSGASAQWRNAATTSGNLL